MSSKKKMDCKEASKTFTNIDLFSKRIELTYEGRMYNDTVFGASTTILLLIALLFIGLHNFVKVSEKQITVVNKDEMWTTSDSN